MSKRSYKSGAEKRKLKEKRDDEKKQLLSKIPKLNVLFQAADADKENNSDLPNTDTSSSSSIAQLAAENTSESKDFDTTIGNVDHSSKDESFFHATPKNSSEIENASSSGLGECDVGECSKSMENLAIESNIYSNDPGLWPVLSNQVNQSNQSILQKYWIKKGTVYSLVRYLSWSNFNYNCQIL